jgi:F0F1-type ATP synthase membrane subunit b/b'
VQLARCNSRGLSGRGGRESVEFIAPNVLRLLLWDTSFGACCSYRKAPFSQSVSSLLKIMESTLHDLGQLLLKAIPTLFLLLVVHLYLKRMFFRPMADVLAKRRAATEGLRESADAMRAKAGEQTKSIEDQLRQARESIYQEQEEARRGWITDQSAQLDKARQQGRELIQQSKFQLDDEAAVAKNQLAETSDALADQIANALLERKPA